MKLPTIPANPFASTLWIDSPNADVEIAEMRQRGEISDEDADLLRRFRRDGWVKVRLEDPRGYVDQIVRDVERAWQEKPDTVLFASKRPMLQRMPHADPAVDRGPGCRIAELHTYSEAARHLYLHPQMHRIADMILGEKAVAIQSIFFEYGSAQGLHRDPVFVPVSEAGHLIAAWIALEDIHPDSGPLMYIPGSHVLPPYEFAPGVYRADPHKPDESGKEQQWLQQQMVERGLEVLRFLPKKGEVLFWHAGLYHGGDWIRDAKRTRKSFVVHYSTRRTHHATAHTILEHQGEEELPKVHATDEQISEGGAVGFASPVGPSRGSFLATLINRWLARRQKQ